MRVTLSEDTRNVLGVRGRSRTDDLTDLQSGAFDHSATLTSNSLKTIIQIDQVNVNLFYVVFLQQCLAYRQGFEPRTAGFGDQNSAN